MHGSARLCKHNDSVGKASFNPRPLSTAALAQSRDVPLGCARGSAATCERTDASVRGDSASREGESHLGRGLAVAPEVAGTCSRVVGRKPQSPPLQGARRCTARLGRAGWRSGAGEPGACSPARMTIRRAEGTAHRHRRCPGSVLGSRPRAMPPPPEALRTGGVPAAAALGVPVTPGLCLRRGSRKVGKCPRSHPSLRKQREMSSVQHAPPAPPAR